MKNRNGDRKEDRRENLCYIEADKPLVYNFFDAKTLQELIDKVIFLENEIKGSNGGNKNIIFNM